MLGNGHELVRIKLDVYSKEDLRDKYPVESKKQIESLATHDAFNSTVAMSNALEEFSARVLILSAEHEYSLRILQDSYLKLMESITTFIVHDNKASKDKNFVNSIKLYRIWSKI